MMRPYLARAPLVSVTHRLDVVATDVLLWVLEAFADPGDYAAAPMIRALKRLAAEPKYNRSGHADQVAERFGLRRREVDVLVAKIRAGCAPKYWSRIEA